MLSEFLLKLVGQTPAAFWSIVFTIDTVDGKKTCTSWYGESTIVYRVDNTSGGAGSINSRLQISSNFLKRTSLNQKCFFIPPSKMSDVTGCVTVHVCFAQEGILQKIWCLKFECRTKASEVCLRWSQSLKSKVWETVFSHTTCISIGFMQLFSTYHWNRSRTLRHSSIWRFQH